MRRHGPEQIKLDFFEVPDPVCLKKLNIGVQ